jgi:ATP synthase protein I
MFRELAYYSSLGFSVALAIFIGVFAGIFIDRWLGTAPWFLFIFFALGIAAAARNMMMALKKSKNTK